MWVCFFINNDVWMFWSRVLSLIIRDIFQIKLSLISSVIGQFYRHGRANASARSHPQPFQLHC